MAELDELKLLLNKLCRQHGFFTDHLDLAKLAALDRLRSVLVRCGNGRFTCAAQDVTHFIGMIEASKGDYVRDLSLLASDAAFLGHYHSYTDFYHRNPATLFAKEMADRARYKNDRDMESIPDYGGTLDGLGNVSSDADPGL